jgi:hypothetical protein
LFNRLDSQPAPVSLHLPFDARTQLVRASQTPITNGDPLARVRAVNQASEQVQRQYPNYFTKETS